MLNTVSPIAEAVRRHLPAAVRKGPRIHWNHRVHQDWARERLHFWRLGFAPTYDHDAILASIRQTFEEKGILSYAVYELTGIHDIIIRMWLPLTCTLQEFRQALLHHLADKDVVVLDVFIATTDPIMHWVFQDPKTGALQEPDLESRLPDSEIELLNEGKLPEDRRIQYEHQNLIAAATPHEGIKFFIVIPTLQAALATAIVALKTELEHILRSADNITEKSLYQGEGFAQFLIMGRVPFDEFDCLRTEIIEAINSRGISPIFGVRTYTFLSLRDDFVGELFQDKMPTIAEAAPMTVVDYLTTYESKRLEVKASAFVDWARWLVEQATDQPQASDHPQASDDVTNEGVIRAVVGLLNAEAGVIVLGALEKRQFPKDPIRSLLESRFPTLDEYYVVGIEEDMRPRDWEAYKRRLLGVLNQRITPQPGPWIRIEMESYGGSALCVITVLQTTANWYYIEDDHRFYVRQENTTQPLPGVAADAYKRERPRPA